MAIQDFSQEIYSVTSLVREARAVLEGSFPMLWVEGEISNLARPASGHLYFSLKDQQCQVRCAMFRSRNNLLSFRPENGLQVLARAQVSLYEGRGDFQLIVERLEPAGEGALRLAFEQLKKRLQTQGLFSDEHKKPVPAFPSCLGVVTSPSGAAIRDILSVLNRRFPLLPVIIYPVQVQGTAAAQAIAGAIRLADERRDCDVLIVARGGGSMEDLWAFNEEPVARAIFDCGLPVVTGIGHEVDFTIADFVADQRAPTPSAAAELLSPDQDPLQARLAALQHALTAAQHGIFQQLGERVASANKRLVHPGRRLQDLAQRVDDLMLRMHSSSRAAWHHQAVQLANAMTGLQGHNPAGRIAQYLASVHYLRQRLDAAMMRRLDTLARAIENTGRALNAISPLATLQRGYAIVRKQPQQHIVLTATKLKPGDRITATLAKGRVSCTVDDQRQDS